MERAGSVVISALGFAESTKAFDEDIDLVVIGHSIPYSDKKKFVSHLRKSCSAPILSLLRHSETPLEGVDFHVSSQSGPTVFLAAIQPAMQSSALQVVIYAPSEHKDEHLADLVRDAVRRIDWALKEVLPESREKHPKDE